MFFFTLLEMQERMFIQMNKQNERRVEINEQFN
jgi:hypothetical protein